MKKQIHIRIESILLEKIDKIGKRNKIIESAVKSYFEQKPESQEAEVKDLKKQIGHLQEINQLQSQRVTDLQTQLGFLQQQYSLLTQKMLPKPSRWKFWKK
jgi:metal-responsive CopG/Arc/MetJ family transcriptional regulator